MLVEMENIIGYFYIAFGHNFNTNEGYFLWKKKPNINMVGTLEFPSSSPFFLSWGLTWKQTFMEIFENLERDISKLLS